MTLNRPGDVREQYRDSSNLRARIELHRRFSTNRRGPHQWVFDRMDLAAAARVLEVGCGPGGFWRLNLDRVPVDWRVVATDMSPGMVAEARVAIADGRFSFMIADAQSIPVEDTSFDAIVANHMLYHVPDLHRALGEFSRVLRPDGLLLASTNGRRHLREIDDLVRSVCYERPINRYVDSFGLESGPPALEQHFDEVAVERYEDALEVTEVEPVIDYVRSMSSFWNTGREELLAAMRGRVAAAIERDGVFRIGKDFGLIRARRR